MYTRYGTYELTPGERETFSKDEVSIIYDENLNGVVINHPENGLLAGDRLRSRKNPHFDPQQPVSTVNRPLTFMFTDDHNAEQSVRLAEVRRAGEGSRLQQILGELSIIGMTLPKMNEADDNTRNRYGASLSRIVDEQRRVLNLHKRQAATELEEGLTILRDRGQDVSPEVSNRILKAVESYSERDTELARQQQANRERQQQLKFEFSADRMVKNAMKSISKSRSSITEDPEAFLNEARKRLTKPGALTVNNAWYHREEEDSWKQLVLAQEGWEPLYGALMHPMSALAGEAMTASADKHELLLGKYTLRLLALEDVIDVSMIGGDYDDLAISLRGILFDTEDQLINARIPEAIKTAQKYRFLLRYRTLPGNEPPEEWYGGLPGIRTGAEPVELSEKEKEDPFHGLD